MELRLDRRALTITTFAEDRRTNRALAYWRRGPAAERVAAVEFLRRQFIGPGARLRRVLRVVDRARGRVRYCRRHALPFHGAPRFTGDLEILVRPTEENGRRVLAAIADFGFQPRRSPPLTSSRRHFFNSIGQLSNTWRDGSVRRTIELTMNRCPSSVTS